MNAAVSNAFDDERVSVKNNTFVMVISIPSAMGRGQTKQPSQVALPAPEEPISACTKEMLLLSKAL